MFRLFFICLALSPAVVSADVEHRFVKIITPMEKNNYFSGIANVGGIGYFYFLDKEWKPEDLRIRIRIYRPVEEGFELFQQQDAEIGQPLPNEPATLQFLVNMKPKKAPKPGKYLYRVDCFDKSGKVETLLASNSIFITFTDAKPPGPQANGNRPARMQRVSRFGSGTHGSFQQRRAEGSRQPSRPGSRRHA